MTRFVRSVYEIKLVLRSPFLFRGLSAKLFGVDAAQLRDELKRPIIPADQVRGVLREGIFSIARFSGDPAKAARDVRTLFGHESAGEPDSEADRTVDERRGNTNAPKRGRIYFSDLTTEYHPARPLETTRVKIDETTGAAQTGALQVLELVAPFGAEVVFKGEIVLYEETRGQWLASLQNALRFQPSIGAFKSVGFGEIVQEQSQIILKPHAAPAAMTLKPEARYRLRVRFDRPFLVDGDKIADNAMTGQIVVPGSVFKGALAENLRLGGEAPESNDVLSKLVFCHAFPENDGGHDGNWPLPYSLVAEKLVAEKDDNGVLHYGDALFLGPAQGAFLAGKPAKFVTDWKESWFFGLQARLGRAEFNDIPPIARTHVKIDYDTGTAQDQALYTTIARSVKGEGGADRSWLLDIDLSTVGEPQTQEVQRLIEHMLAHGLDNIGKTAAHASFEQVDKPTFEHPKPIYEKPDEFTLMLLTPALMLDPAKIWNADGSEKLTALAAYADYFKLVFPQFELLNFYAEQEVSGGYIARRYRAYGAKEYFPFLLTKAGAIFRFKGDYKDADLATRLRTGLPVFDLTKAEPLTWRNCPYVPENGYGHFTTVHLSDKTTFELTKAITVVGRQA